MSKSLDYVSTRQLRRFYNRAIKRARSNDRQGFRSLGALHWSDAKEYQDELNKRSVPHE